MQATTHNLADQFRRIALPIRFVLWLFDEISGAVVDEKLPVAAHSVGAVPFGFDARVCFDRLIGTARQLDFFPADDVAASLPLKIFIDSSKALNKYPTPLVSVMY